LIERYAGCGRSLLAFLHLIQDEAGFDYSRSNATQLALRERSMLDAKPPHGVGKRSSLGARESSDARRDRCFRRARVFKKHHNVKTGNEIHFS
jgi:hypothetical protein